MNANTPGFEDGGPLAGPLSSSEVVEAGDEEETLAFVVAADEAGQRLDRLALTRFPGLSRSRLQAWIDEGHVHVNNAPGKAGGKLKAGDLVAVAPPPAVETTVLAERIPLDVVYEDGDLLVINKAQGMVVHPAPGSPRGTLVNALLAHCKDLSGIGGVLRPGIVHRLDKDTSGLMVVAKHDRAHLGLAAQIASKAASRRYWAVVSGHMDPTDGRIEAPMGRDPRNRQKMAIVTGGKDAATRWTTMGNYGAFAWLMLDLETGRTHQIRVHLAHLGHPVVGDPIYGGDRKIPVKLAGQALHARELAFKHPMTGEALSFTAPPPETFQALLNYLQRTLND